MARPSVVSAVPAAATDPALADRSRQSAAEAGVSVAERLAGELALAWRGGDRLLVEEFLARHPELRADSEVTLRLLYEELCLRQELDHTVTEGEILRRFPHLGSEVGRLVECHQVLQPLPPPRFPEVGETVGGFRLVAELGRGAQGRVFLATQPALADRPVVLKLAAEEFAGLEGPGDEHLSLARLQHTHIVPLYAREVFPELRLRALCMPYLGGTTLAELLQALAPLPPARRTGRHLLDALDRAEAAVPALALRAKAPGAARAFLARASYAQAVCWIAACLAEALHYAHERGLLHLDVKPGNVLLAADGQPLLLDFHLAREPLPAGQPPPAWLGGTPSYMSPEQRAALAAVRRRQPLAQAVDARSDIYALGVLLHEALQLGARNAECGTDDGPALHVPRAVLGSVGLADVIRRCLEPDPRRRYPDAASVAVDLRRHLDNLPLRGVPNRSPVERWRKWRRRRPHALAVLGLLLAFVAAVLTVAALGLTQYESRYRGAEQALDRAREQFRNRRYTDAVQTLTAGTEQVEWLPGAADLKKGLAVHLRRARRAEAAQQLHSQAQLSRFLLELNDLAGDRPGAPPRGQGRSRDRRLALILPAGCREAWGTRHLLTLSSPETALETDDERAIRFDLIDVAVFWADLQVRLAREQDLPRARREALALLEEADRLCGPSPILDEERRARAAALGLPEPVAARPAGAGHGGPLSAEEHGALARHWLNAGDSRRAAAAIREALRLEPEGFWPNYYHGVWAYRHRRYAAAVESFCVCVGGLSDGAAECLWKRAEAYAALGRTDESFRDLARALGLKPELVVAAFDRAALDRLAEAAAGADPAENQYRLALIALAQNDRPAGLEHLERALRHNPGHRDALGLRGQLLPGHKVATGER
jgi:serine/threonine protein kinase